MAFFSKILGDSNERYHAFACEHCEQVQTLDPALNLPSRSELASSYGSVGNIFAGRVGRIAPPSMGAAPRHDWLCKFSAGPDV